MLDTGTRLGRYEIRSKIGEGGMGEVYLARDTQLDRPIALKLLTADVARDPQRLHRFLQEARAASALSHANVAHIYEIGDSDGAHFIAMEFVEGEPLDKKIGGRPLDVAELLDIAIQIADALDEAHAKGITHRDIKSSNIMITSRGRVKVLDFGLAKLTLPAGVTDRTSDSELATRVKTSPGVVMGTVNYMSPEQALGREVDHRTDIFSFGVVLYEMATGRLPFTGNTVTETIDRIAHAQPEAIARLNYDIPAELEGVVRKTLRKDRDERYQAIHDVLVDLKELKRDVDMAAGLERSTPPASRSTEVATQTFTQSGTGATSVPPESQTSAVPAHPTSSAEYVVGEIKRHKTVAILLIAAVIVIGILVGVGAVGFGVYKFVVQRPAQTITKPAALSSNMKISLLTANGKTTEAAISPDGKYFVYVVQDGGKQSLWLRQVATSSNVQVVAPADVQYGRETFSPDGNYVYYIVTEPQNPQGALYRAPVLGGVPSKILTNIGSSITFSPDGSRIAFIRNDESATGEDVLMIANLDGANERRLAARKADKWFDFGGPAWSPDGKVIATGVGSYEGGLHQTVVAYAVEDGAVKEFTSQRWSDGGRVSWLADGSALVTSGADLGSEFSQLWEVSYPEGVARRITNNLNANYGPTLTADSKSILAVQANTNANIWLGPSVDAGGARQITSGQLEGSGGAVWTPDGRIVYSSYASGNADIWIMNSDGTGQQRLTNDPELDYTPAVSPDGRYIVFVSQRASFPNLWRMDRDGSNLKQLTNNTEDYNPQISFDGRWIVFDSWRSGRDALWKMPIDGGTPVQITDKFTKEPAISPDGKLIACFYKDEQPSAPWRIMVLPFDGGPSLKTFDLPTTVDKECRDGSPAWTPDSRAITYFDKRSGTMNLWSQPLDGGAPKPLTTFATNGVSRRAWSRDGKQLLLTRATITTDVVLIRDFR
jgi:serine/threonine protein kinase/Tol biopolymer transport system component